MRKLISGNPRILAILSEVDASPQLVSILAKVQAGGGVIEVIVIGSNKSKILSELESLGVRPINLRSRGKYGSLPLFLLLFFYIFRAKPSTVFTSGQFATIIGIFCAKVLRVKKRIFIRHYSNFHIKYKKRLGNLLDRAVNFLATDIVAVSLLVKKVLIEDENARSEKIRVIYNGIDLKRFQRIAVSNEIPREEIETRVKVFRIGVISRMTELKGIEYIAKAFVRLHGEFPQTRLHIVGAHSDSYDSVLNILNSIESDAFVIEESNNSIPDFLWGLDAFVHVPNGPEDESFGLVYIEALAAAVPSIFTVSGILNELPNAGSYATIVPYRDPEAIYRGLSDQIKGVSIPKIEVPRPWLEQFSLSFMASKYSELILG